MGEAQVSYDSGKLTFIHYISNGQLGVTCKYLLNSKDKMQVEICLTSNVMTGGAPSLELHHFGWFLNLTQKFISRIIIFSALNFSHTEFVQLTSTMQSTLCPCAQMILDCSQQASQMSITSLQRLSVCPLLANKDLRFSFGTDWHVFFGRSQQVRAVSASPGCSAVCFC